MIDFVPLDLYAPLFYNLLLIVVCYVWFNSRFRQLDDQTNLNHLSSIGVILLVLLIPYIGLRPISGTYFGDTSTYANMFETYTMGHVVEASDAGFNGFMKLCTNIMGIHSFLLLCSFLFIFPMYLASKKLFAEYWFYAFLMLVAGFSFWGAAVNGVRSGVATSFIILAFAYREKKVLMILLLLVAISFHKSMLLPICAYFLTYFYNDTKKYLALWVLCIPLALVAGGFFEGIFTLLGFDDRTSGYFTDEFDEQFSSTGFRWDFLLYSAMAVFAGWYFIIKKKFDDRFYQNIFNTYLIANAFWILIIRASFSNRFAYLSWFLMGLIIVYPFLKMQFFKKQSLVLGNIIIIYFIFTYVLNVVLAK